MGSASDNKGVSPAKLLRELGIRPSRARGQHFLHDRNIVKKIVDLSGVTEQSTVLEIGPGLGILTFELAKSVCQVIAIESDSRLSERLFHIAPQNVDVVLDDALTADFVRYAGTQYDVVANLPYSIATRIIRRLFEAEVPPRSITVMVQREVAGRMVASPPDMSVLSVAVQLYGSPRVLFHVGRGAFVPPPKVESSVVKIDVSDPGISLGSLSRFFAVVHAGFAQRRKTVINALDAGLELPRHTIEVALADADIESSSRAQQLSLVDWKRFFRHIEPHLRYD